MSYETRYAARRMMLGQQDRERRDTAASREYRRKRALVVDRVIAERAELYPIITPDNAQEIIDWQSGRIEELMNEDAERIGVVKE